MLISKYCIINIIFNDLINNFRYLFSNNIELSDANLDTILYKKNIWRMLIGHNFHENLFFIIYTLSDILYHLS